MKASETKLQPILEGTKQYVVPLFQRPYSWGRKEWDVLWEDLTSLCENEGASSHFIGSIVTMPTVSIPEGVTKYLLIDGQQRLTTIFILLTLLRDAAESKNNHELAQEIEQTMLVNPFKKGVDYLKLLPTQIDRDVFQSLLEREKSKRDGLILECYKFFERKLRQTTVEMATLSKVVTTRLSVVSIVLDRDDNPHLVFESLNAKGRPLTQSDLIRNYFFMRINIDEQEATHTKYWEPIQNALGENLTECIRHYLMRNGSIVKQSDIYFTLKDYIDQTDADALKSLEDIATFAGYYEKFINPEKEQDQKLRYALKRIKRLDVTTTYPFLLNCYHDYTQDRIKQDELLKIFQVIENYIIRRFICNIPTNQLSKIFPSLYKQAQLKNPASLVNGICSLLQTRNYPKDNEFRMRLTDSKLYGEGERQIKTKLILESLEMAYQHKEQVDFDNLTIEHIMPQTLTPWWQEHLGDNWPIDHELCLHTIGNLTLTGYNAELSNAPFDEKRLYFSRSHLELNKFFQDISVWNRKSIEARSTILADLALTVWPYFGEENISTTGNDDNMKGKKPVTVKVLGQKFPVKTWRDVMECTLNTIAQLEPEMFAQLVSEYPRFISPDSTKFRCNRQLSGNGFFIEVNLSARDIHRFCTQAIQSIGLSNEDWSVETS